MDQQPPMHQFARRPSANLNGSPLRASPNGVLAHSSTCSSLSGQTRRPFLIGVAGGTASGKTTVCERIIDEVLAQNKMSERKIFSISQDAFYRNLNAKEIAQAEKGTFNFDHPGA